ncbi:MAG: hypothetical protein QM682_14530 [Paracoccus sp. (in: a-proteobacteria)]|uniref:hypothetical protein n=1 Tax=Paracoccus sp. TaxID=267 RepID=UPI0039E6F440
MPDLPSHSPPDSPRPWARVILAALLFLPVPLIAAFPGAAAFLADRWLGVPAAVLVIPAYLLVFILMAQSNSGFAARMGG